jgi:ribosomal protein uL24
MKSDTERKRYYQEKLHKKKNRLHAHLSKDLRTKLKLKKRAVLLRKGDTVRIMRGPEKGKEAKVGKINTTRRKVYLEGVVVKNTRGKEVGIPLEPSNLLLIALEATPERKQVFGDEAFKKKEVSKPKTEAKEKTAGTEASGKEEKGEEHPKGSHTIHTHSSEHAHNTRSEHTHESGEHKHEPKNEHKSEHKHEHEHSTEDSKGREHAKHISK